MKKMNKKGFTLAELLIVVAIIAVLVAIAIPVFTTQLEASKEAVDAANIRAAYAEAKTKALATGEAVSTSTEGAKQGRSGWDRSFDWPESQSVTAKKDGATWTVKVNADGKLVSIS